MKVVIFAGGYGTRLSEATNLIPKPMGESGGKPILWHIMKIYSRYGFNDFVICCGYKQYVIKEYFANYFNHNCDIMVDLSAGSLHVLDNHSEPWRVTMVDTGLHTMTGGRLKRVEKYVGREPFLLTYGDGVADVNVLDEIAAHHANGALLTLMAYRPQGKFGALDIDGDRVRSFSEKPREGGGWINAGFFVCEPEVFDYLPAGDDTAVLEREPLEAIARDGRLFAYRHTGFWHPMDTMKDCNDLNALWESGKAPW